jgi:hypothetical protein
VDGGQQFGAGGFWNVQPLRPDQPFFLQDLSQSRVLVHGEAMAGWKLSAVSRMVDDGRKGARG